MYIHIQLTPTLDKKIPGSAVLRAGAAGLSPQPLRHNSAPKDREYGRFSESIILELESNKFLNKGGGLS